MLVLSSVIAFFDLSTEFISLLTALVGDFSIGASALPQQLGVGRNVISQPVPFVTGGVLNMAFDDVSGSVSCTWSGRVRTTVASCVISGSLNEHGAPCSG